MAPRKVNCYQKSAYGGTGKPHRISAEGRTFVCSHVRALFKLWVPGRTTRAMGKAAEFADAGIFMPGI